MTINFDDMLKKMEDDNRPSWVGEDKESPVYRAYEAIKKIKKEKINHIRTKLKVVNTKTPASIHTIKQQEVCSFIDVKPQNLFYTSNKSNEEQREGLLQCLKDANQELETELKKFQLRKANHKGLMNTKKEDLANEYRKLEKKCKDLEAQNLEAVTEKILNRFPFDIKKKLGLME